MNNIKALSSNSFGHHVALNTFLISYNKIQKLTRAFSQTFRTLKDLIPGKIRVLLKMF
jgi:hypothetical protein